MVYKGTLISKKSSLMGMEASGIVRRLVLFLLLPLLVLLARGSEGGGMNKGIKGKGGVKASTSSFLPHPSPSLSPCGKSKEWIREEDYFHFESNLV